VKDCGFSEWRGEGTVVGRSDEQPSGSIEFFDDVARRGSASTSGSAAEDFLAEA
jgi:hypothetical protein